MSRWAEIARKKPFSLMVSIPRNTAEMARAAEEGGADAVKVHINNRHPASGHLFGSFKQERKNFEKILKSITIPLGIVPGGFISKTVTRMAPSDELREMRKMGFDFFDAFAHHVPLDYLDVPLGRMVCIDSRYDPEDARSMAVCGAQVFEASVIPHEGYGKPVVFADLCRWKELTDRLGAPLLVSTQRKIRPEECGLLHGAGVRGIVIGVVVTGESRDGVYQTTKRFREAIDRLTH